jgi:hypothetical protein
MITMRRSVDQVADCIIPVRPVGPAPRRLFIAASATAHAAVASDWKRASTRSQARISDFLYKFHDELAFPKRSAMSASPASHDAGGPRGAATALARPGRRGRRHMRSFGTDYGATCVVSPRFRAVPRQTAPAGVGSACRESFPGPCGAHREAAARRCIDNCAANAANLVAWALAHASRRGLKPTLLVSAPHFLCSCQ